MNRQIGRSFYFQRAVRQAEDHMDRLKSCLIFLVSHGIHVLGYLAHTIDGRDCVTVTVAPSPQLHQLYSGSCTTVRRRQEGDIIYETWIGLHPGRINVEWEETRCGM
jgi:hypothetical protein